MDRFPLWASLLHRGVTFVPADGAQGGATGGAGEGDSASSASAAPTTALGGAPADNKAPADTGAADQNTAPADKSGDAKPPSDDTSSQETKPGDEPGAEAEEFSLAAPEGFEQFADDFRLFSDDMGGWLKANPNATAREALQEAAARQARLAAVQTEQATKDFAAQVATWEKEARADPEIGGDQYDANVAVAMKAMTAFGSPELTDLLNQTGMGNHPALIRFAIKAGKAVSDAPVVTGGERGTRKSVTDSIYPE